MIWGMATGEMGVNNLQEQVVWGIIGVLTGLILVFSGGHFFTGMWQSLKHRNTNMDTLVALGYWLSVAVFDGCRVVPALVTG